MAPVSGTSKPAIRLSSVDLPQPLGPSRATISPRLMARLQRSIATTPSKNRPTSTSSSSATVVASWVGGAPRAAPDISALDFTGVAVQPLSLLRCGVLLVLEEQLRRIERHQFLQLGRESEIGAGRGAIQRPDQLFLHRLRQCQLSVFLGGFDVLRAARDAEVVRNGRDTFLRRGLDDIRGHLGLIGDPDTEL